MRTPILLKSLQLSAKYASSLLIFFSGNHFKTHDNFVFCLLVEATSSYKRERSTRAIAVLVNVYQLHAVCQHLK